MISVTPRYAAPLPPAPLKAGPIGPGAGVLQTEFPLAMILGNQQNPQQRMLKALQLAQAAGWPEAAEDAIGMAITGQPWALTDAEEATVDDAYPNPLARRALTLLESPYASADQGRKYTRSELWRMTLRHMGLCGNAFWFLDSVDLAMGLPAATLYIAPWRMSPNEDAAGNLLSWQLDRTAQKPGTTVELDEVIHYMLRPPDIGHFGRGLVETALLKLQNDVGLDKHVQQVLSAGGRLSGFLAPKQGDSIQNDNIYNQMVADARTIVEQPDAAKRLQVLRAPIDFTATTMSPAELQVVDLMKLTRDDLLALWGVPLSQIGGSNPAGLNSGETRKYDKQAMWENANHPRIVMFEEAIQASLIDRMAKVGILLDFDIEEPEFDDDSSRFDLLGKSLNAPLRNRERRALVGLEPFGPQALNTEGTLLDDDVWMPIAQALAFSAPEDVAAGNAPTQTDLTPAPPERTPPDSGNDAVAMHAGEQSATVATGKATIRPNVRSLHASLTTLRRSMDERVTPRLTGRVHTVLDDQRREISARAKAHAAHLMKNPGDSSVWWDGPKWDRQMRAALQPGLVTMAEEVDTHIRAALGKTPVGKAGPVGAVQHTLTKGATRVTKLNDRTRDGITAKIRLVVAKGIDEGKSPAEVGDDLEAELADATLENGVSMFDEYRAEMIARTELMSSYNDATLGSYTDADVTQVQAIDGDGDEECAERDGQTFDIDEADGIEDHPNGTLDWVPILPDESDAAA